MLDNSYQKYIVLIVPYGLTVSTLYLFGYWSSFEVNIFEYIGISDVLKIALYQLAHYGSLILIGIITAELFITPIMRYSMKPGEGANDPEVIFIKKHWRFFALMPAGLVAYILLFTNNEARWFVAAIIIIPLTPFILGNNTFLSDVIPKSSLRNTVTYLISIFLLFSYSWGTVDAMLKKNKESNVIINNETNKKTYIGRASNHVFLWDNETKTVLIMSTELIKTMKYEVKKQPSFVDRLLKSDKEEPNR